MKILELLYENQDIDLNRAYELFKASYTKSTGIAWSKEKFLSRASNWEFYGDYNGYVAVRVQRGGFVKLVGVGGSPRSIMKGMSELGGKPIWGLISKDMVGMAGRYGLKSPPAFVIKLLMKVIPASVWGDVPTSINNDGSVTLSYNDVGDATKFFVASSEYYDKLLGSFDTLPGMDKIPDLVKMGVKKALRMLV
jgi:hypothetical protein